MADVLANGFGNVSGSRASPQTLLSVPAGGGAESGGLNFVTLKNAGAAGLLFAKASDDPGCYCCASAGGFVTICRGNPSANNARQIQGFATADDGTSVATVPVFVTAKKLA